MEGEMSARAIVVTLTLLICSTHHARAVDQEHKVIIADYPQSPASTAWSSMDAFIHCDAPDRNLQYQQICAIRSESGVKYFPFDVRFGSDDTNGHCGVKVMYLTCHNMPDDTKVEWDANSFNCVASDPAQCNDMRTTDSEPWPTFVRCGPNAAEQMAQKFCGKSPHQIFVHSDRSGGACGLKVFKIGCHLPK
jgi:hypothetical protein